jgi:hypothetical protein
METPHTEMKQPLSLAEAAQLRFLDPAKVRFSKAGATLRMTLKDEACWLKVSILRAFPLSMPTRYFSVRDDSGKEIGMLVDFTALDAESRTLVEAELERRYLVSIVHRVLSVKERFGTVDWEVETHRGHCRFTTRDLRENVLRSGPGHFLLTDVENNRYEVLDLNRLDPQSQASLLRHL